MRITLVVLAGILFPFLMTTLGSAVVFFFQRKMTEWMERVFLSFAAGIMIAASFWSLLSPAIEQAHCLPGCRWALDFSWVVCSCCILIVYSHDCLLSV